MKYTCNSINLLFLTVLNYITNDESFKLILINISMGDQKKYSNKMLKHIKWMKILHIDQHHPESCYESYVPSYLL